ncbi:MAG: hypothetical protein G01um10142_547 [Parcubacteria group bacterium Gr01-1014_2]|nr:MAG: hypothetical protein G01um10142_547 [Parcubacteria group bacterium Gr01-1014_2]
MAQMVLRRMLDKVMEHLPGIVAKYAKRGLERLYDRAFETPLGQKLKSLGMPKKYVLEFLLYNLTELFESRWKDNTGLRHFLKEVTVDVSPEIAKRMINGVREEILASVETAPAEEKELASFLLELEDQDLIELINWLYQKTSAEIKQILVYLRLFSAEQIARLMGFTDQDREKFFDILNPQPPSQEAKQGILKAMTDDVGRLRKRIRQQIIRQRRKAGRK